MVLAEELDGDACDLGVLHVAAEARRHARSFCD